MAYIISDNITSPIGDGTAENISKLRNGVSSLRHYEPQCLGVGEAFTASLSARFTDDAEDGLTPFERICLHSIKRALDGCERDIDLSSPRTALIISTTKGNVEGLLNGSGRVLPSESSSMIASRLGIRSEPIVVCDACISGLAAIILAERLIGQGTYDTAIVCGADVPRKFIMSGFQTLKAVSQDCCRPFDMNRNGLNLGEAAATIIMSREPDGGRERWRIDGCAIRNDAYHLSAPHKRGEGLLMSIEETLKGHRPEDISLINAHGTATLFNDQMESVAIERAGLSAAPLNGIKGYYGHTMGAAGVLETIVSLHMMDDGYALPTRGFEELGVSGKVNISGKEVEIAGESKRLLKLMSGFGGCNASALFSKGNLSESEECGATRQSTRSSHRVIISSGEAMADGVRIGSPDGDDDFITSLYKKLIGGYARFYKMDMLSRLGFVASEILLGMEADVTRFEERADRAIVLFNRTSSLHTDKAFAEGICDDRNYFPSPSTFIYTLPNIVTGEIAIRNKYHGETSFYMLARKDERLMREITEATFADKATKSVVAGWVDYENESSFEADISIYFRE